VSEVVKVATLGGMHERPTDPEIDAMIAELVQAGILR
jgi:hypothetical protein